MDVALVFAVIVVPVVLNVWATWLVLKDGWSGGSRRAGQLLLVWLVPVVGSIVVLAVHRTAEPPSKKYRRPPDPGDDFALSGRSMKATREAIDADDA